MSLFSAIEMAPRDPILGLIEQFSADSNPNKVNLGVGVYYDDSGKLPLLKCVQAAEAQIMGTPKARGYLPIDGIAAYDGAVRAWSLAPTARRFSQIAWPRFKPSVAPADSKWALTSCVAWVPATPF